MPRATVSTDVERFDLKTLPEGFVELKRMTYGQLLERVEMGMKMAMQGKQGSKDVNMDLKLVQREVTAFEFGICIVSHNLEDADGTLLNFKVKGTFETLDPKVGSEVSKLIDDMNQFEATEGDLVAALVPTS